MSFYICLISISRQYRHNLFQELEKMGILRTDPRLTPLMETLRMIKRKTFGAIYGIDNIKLDFNQFQKYETIPYLTWTKFSFACRVIKPSIVIIVKAFKGQLVIPEFDAFTKDITDVYEKWGLLLYTDPRHSLWCRLSHSLCSITLDFIPNMIDLIGHRYRGSASCCDRHGHYECCIQGLRYASSL